MPIEKDYLGDGIYIADDGWGGFTLTCENGIAAYETIVFGPYEVQALERYIARMRDNAQRLANDSSKSEKRYWWLSFASEEKFLGVAIVEGSDIVEAARNAHERNINPGGQVAGFELLVPAEQEEWTNRLLTKEEAMGLQDKFHTVDGKPEDQAVKDVKVMDQ